MTKQAQSSEPKARSSEHKIQWLNLPGYKGETWNPIAGCSKVSEGCRSCYAEKMAVRLASMAIAHVKPMSVGKYVKVIKGRHWDGTTYFNKEELTTPLKWKNPRLVFVCSMGDLFHEDTSYSEIDAVYDTMEECPQHLFIVLTKRAKRMYEYYRYRLEQGLAYGHSWIWVGVSAENQDTANERIPYLLQTPAEVRMVSIEPMLGPVDLTKINTEMNFYEFDSVGYKYLNGVKFEGPKIDWVIVGGESGPKARPVHPDWVRGVRDQCKQAGVPFFFKQWGEWLPVNQNNGDRARTAKRENLISMSVEGDSGPLFETDYMIDERNYLTIAKIGRKAAGNLLDGKVHEEYPKF